MNERIEWAIDYHDGNGPTLAGSEFSARSWARYWNEHRDEHDAEATVVRRQVTFGDWLTAEDQP